MNKQWTELNELVDELGDEHDGDIEDVLELLKKEKRERERQRPHPYHCVKCGFGLSEANLGTLLCLECLEVYLPSRNDHATNEARLSWHEPEED